MIGMNSNEMENWLSEQERYALRAGLKAGGAPLMWERLIRDLLPWMRRLAPKGSRVLEVGYGDGLLSCWLCRELGWRIRGLDISMACRIKAMKHAQGLGVADCVEFECCLPEETWEHAGEYDAVFIKTVLYNAPDLETYGEWLDWVLLVLKPGGVLINFETGRANSLVQAYRRARKREYTESCLYTREVERLYDDRFEVIERRYYGGWSQFLAPMAPIYRAAARIEETRERHAGNCFAVGMIAKKRMPDIKAQPGVGQL